MDYERCAMELMPFSDNGNNCLKSGVPFNEEDDINDMVITCSSTSCTFCFRCHKTCRDHWILSVEHHLHRVTDAAMRLTVSTDADNTDGIQLFSNAISCLWQSIGCPLCKTSRLYLTNISDTVLMGEQMLDSALNDAATLLTDLLQHNPLSIHQESLPLSSINTDSESSYIYEEGLISNFSRLLQTEEDSEKNRKKLCSSNLKHSPSKVSDFPLRVDHCRPKDPSIFSCEVENFEGESINPLNISVGENCGSWGNQRDFESGILCNNEPCNPRRTSLHQMPAVGNLETKEDSITANSETLHERRCLSYNLNRPLRLKTPIRHKSLSGSSTVSSSGFGSGFSSCNSSSPFGSAKSHGPSVDNTHNGFVSSYADDLTSLNMLWTSLLNNDHHDIEKGTNNDTFLSTYTSEFFQKNILKLPTTSENADISEATCVEPRQRSGSMECSQGPQKERMECCFGVVRNFKTDGVQRSPFSRSYSLNTPAHYLTSKPNSKGNIFRQRKDFSAFRNLHPSKRNGYFIQLEDDSCTGNEDTRSFLLCQLTNHGASELHCIACQLALPVYDHFPVVDGVLFLSPVCHRPQSGAKLGGGLQVLWKSPPASDFKTSQLIGNVATDLAPPPGCTGPRQQQSQILSNYDRKNLQNGLHGHGPSVCQARYLHAICLRCMKSTNEEIFDDQNSPVSCSPAAHIMCRNCKTPWNGSTLLIGGMYTYDLFACMPCCSERLKCNSCGRSALSSQEPRRAGSFAGIISRTSNMDRTRSRRSSDGAQVGLQSPSAATPLPFFSQYSNLMCCQYCQSIDYHFIKPFDEVFSVLFPDSRHQ